MTMQMSRRDFVQMSAVAVGATVLSGCRTFGTGEELPHYCVGTVADSAQYECLHPHFKKAFEFLRRKDLASLPNGTYKLAGDDCRAIIQDADLVPLQERKVECHRAYIDIQSPITGPEAIGVFQMDEAHLALPFDEKSDCVVFDGPAPLMTVLRPGSFAIFFPPKGGHAPSCRAPDGPRRIRKVVIKVRWRSCAG